MAEQEPGQRAQGKSTQKTGKEKRVGTSGSESTESSSSGLSKALGTLTLKEKSPQRSAEDSQRYQGYVGQRWTGVCKWFNVSKGFGFVLPNHEEAKARGDDVFVHQSALQMPGFRSLDEGASIEFTVRLGRRGLEAENVTGISGAEIRGHSIRPLGKKKDKMIRCYNCGQLGYHKAAKCKKADAPAGSAKTCYHCREEGHVLAECEKYLAQKSTKQGTSAKEGKKSEHK